MGRGAATYRKRDLRVALECVKPGDEVKLDLKAGTVTIIPGGKPGEAKEPTTDENIFDVEAEKLRRRKRGTG
jgi:hypothetical protein